MQDLIYKRQMLLRQCGHDPDIFEYSIPKENAIRHTERGTGMPIWPILPPSIIWCAVSVTSWLFACHLMCCQKYLCCLPVIWCAMSVTSLLSACHLMCCHKFSACHLMCCQKHLCCLPVIWCAVRNIFVVCLLFDVLSETSLLSAVPVIWCTGRNIFVIKAV